jgi:hypothetical protein
MNYLNVFSVCWGFIDGAGVMLIYMYILYIDHSISYPGGCPPIMRPSVSPKRFLLNVFSGQYTNTLHASYIQQSTTYLMPGTS